MPAPLIAPVQIQAATLAEINAALRLLADEMNEALRQLAERQEGTPRR